MKVLILMVTLFGHSFGFASPFTQLVDDSLNKPELSDSALTPDMIAKKKEIVVLLHTAAVKESKDNEIPNAEKDFTGFKPDDMEKAYFEIVQDLYYNGYVKKVQIDAWTSSFSALKNVVDPERLERERNINYENRIIEFWKQKYVKVFDDFFVQVTASPQSCVDVGQISSKRKCCVGLVSYIDLEKDVSQNSCSSVGKTCSTDTQCCSGACQKETPGAVSGKCLEVMKCYPIHEEGKTCSSSSPFCASGSCESFSLNHTGLVQCKKVTKQCSINSDCCSDSCVNNKCDEAMKCLKCRKGKEKLDEQMNCCPGYLQMEDKTCVPPIPIYVPTVEVKKNLFKKLIDIIFPSAYAQSGTTPVTSNTDVTSQVPDFEPSGVDSVDSTTSTIVTTEDIANSTLALSTAQQALIDEKKSACNEDEDCMASVTSLETSFGKDQYTGMTQGQMDTVAQGREDCTKGFSTTRARACSEDETPPCLEEDPGHASCMSAVDTLEQSFLTENANAVPPILGVSLKKEEYIDKYNIPGVTAKTYSDIKNCEFNSFNDSWRDASNGERNAEVFLRSFEFVFSHKGAQDYWADENKGNVFSRANKVAKDFRNNRADLILKMVEIDKRMACKCIAVFGPAKFSSAKQAFFNSSCEEEKIALQTDLGTGGEDSNIDGTSVATLSEGVTDVDQDAAVIEEVDKAAVGISNEKLLIEWLQLRAEAQMQRFVDNSDLEEELNDLSDYISNADFHQVFKDRIERNNFIEATPDRGDSEVLFKWGYSYYPGWLAFFVTALAGGGLLEALTFKNKTKGAGGLFATATILAGMMAAWHYHESDEIYANPSLQDTVKKKKTYKKKWGIVYKKYDGFTRRYIGPRFDNKAAGDNRCYIYARASACVRTAYRVDFDDADNYILDPTLPLFVPAGQININFMPGYQMSWVQMINQARHLGIEHLKLEDKGGYLGGKAPRNTYRKKSKKYGKNDFMSKAIKAGYFQPKQGDFTEVTFGNRRDLIMNAARTYARCKNLRECGAVEGVDEDDIGYGYLFETDEEALQFADYTYQIHYLWSHLTQNNYMGYPTSGMDQYFRFVAYNMKLVGSLSASRAVTYANAAKSYEDDWNSRKEEYKSLGEANMGTQSRGLTYSTAFFKAFGELNFSGETNIQAFKSSMNQANSSGGNFSKAELSALNAGTDSAIRRNVDIKKRDAFDKALLNASDQTRRAVAANAKSLGKINSPLSQFSMTKLGGGGRGFKKLTNAINSMNSSIKDMNANKKGNNGVSSYKRTPFTMPSLLTRPNSGSGSKYKGNIDYTGKNQFKDQNMSLEEVDSLLGSLKKSSSELERLDQDSIFKIVSKAYKRNYGRVLTRDVIKKKIKVISVKDNVSDKDKKALKDLLGE